MRKLLALLPFSNRQANADPRAIAALQTYVDALIDVLRENCRAYRTSLQSDVEGLTSPADMTVMLRNDVSFALQATGLMARSYYDALRQLTLPEGATMTQPSYSKKTNTVSCQLDCNTLLRNIRLEMLEPQS